MYNKLPIEHVHILRYFHPILQTKSQYIINYDGKQESATLLRL